jgi:hypothetical protein
MIRAFVFDLDGTLVETEELDSVGTPPKAYPYCCLGVGRGYEIPRIPSLGNDSA